MAAVIVLREVGDTYMGEVKCIQMYAEVNETLGTELPLYVHRILPSDLNQDNPLDFIF